jgi:hypothetical protein
MRITFGNKYIEITNNYQAIEVEKVLNKEPYAGTWGKIGDALYYFTDIEVDSSRFYVLKELVEKLVRPHYFTVVL